MPLTLKVAIFMLHSMPSNADPAISCGILVLNRDAELLLCHATGTPRWDIPKGGADPGETELQAAIRETAEETGLQFTPGQLVDLGRFAYRRGKDLHLYAALIERIEPSSCRCSTTFRDARGRLVPEMDRFEWVAFGRVGERCGKSLVAVLTDKVRLPALLQRLAPSGR
jgi:8-oxo-dGTP pyrophosphatase MutT (NUDIX family)